MVLRLRGGGEVHRTFIYMGELFELEQHCPSISALKEYIYSALGIPMRDQVITMGGKVVGDGMSILNIASTLTERNLETCFWCLLTSMQYRRIDIRGRRPISCHGN